MTENRQKSVKNEWSYKKWWWQWDTIQVVELFEWFESCKVNYWVFVMRLFIVYNLITDCSPHYPGNMRDKEDKLNIVIWNRQLINDYDGLCIHMMLTPVINIIVLLQLYSPHSPSMSPLHIKHSPDCGDTGHCIDI